ncbi:MAG: hypothetical protein QM796_18540 [Chthoniobacteraceae bacterium]
MNNINSYQLYLTFAHQNSWVAGNVPENVMFKVVEAILTPNDIPYWMRREDASLVVVVNTDEETIDAILDMLDDPATLQGAYLLAEADNAPDLEVDVEQLPTVEELPDLIHGPIPFGTVMKVVIDDDVIERLPEGAILARDPGGYFFDRIGRADSRVATLEKARKYRALGKEGHLYWDDNSLHCLESAWSESLTFDLQILTAFEEIIPALREEFPAELAEILG